MARTKRAAKSRSLPALYLIADMDTAKRLDVDLVDVVRDFVAAGGRMVSLRPGGATDRKIMAVGRKIAAILYAARATFVVHRRLDLVLLLGADGVHLPSHGFTRRDITQILGRSAVMGRSCHTKREIEQAHGQDFGFATLGPLFESVSKPGYGPGLEAAHFEEIAAATNLPIFALGGVLPQNAARCVELGAAGVAVVGGIVGADDPRKATRRYLEALEPVCGV